MIVTGSGVNVFPDEIEALISGTAGVREACVIGLDRGSGDEVDAVMVPDGSGRPLEEVVHEVNRRLDPLQQITSFTVWPDSDLPKTTTLNVKKFLVRERLSRRDELLRTDSGDRLTLLIAGVTAVPVGQIKEESRLVTDLGLT